MKSFAHHYSSDISREQFELIRTDLEGIRKRTKPRKVDLYDIFCALLYTLKNGCVWRDCERKLNTSKMMISLAFLRILLKRF